MDDCKPYVFKTTNFGKSYQGDQSWNWGNKQFRGQNAPYGAVVIIDTGRNLTAFKGQLDERRASGREMRGDASQQMAMAVGEEIRKLDSVRLQLTRPKSDIIPFYSEGPRPLERAMSLMQSIDNGLAPVVAAQREYLGDVRRDAQTVIDMVERQVDATVQQKTRYCSR